MRKERHIGIPCIWVLGLCLGLGQWGWANGGKAGFVENKGPWHPSFYYRYASDRAEILPSAQGWHIYLYEARAYHHPGFDKRPEARSETMLREGTVQGLRVRFLGSRAQVQPRGLHASYTRYNYFLGHEKARWGTDARAYDELLYCDLYEGIDITLGMKERVLKYNIIVHPGARLQALRMQIEGAQGLHVEDDHLYIQTLHGTLRERIPLAYQITKQGDTLRVRCQFYKINNTTIGFRVKDYRPEHLLVIDPTLEMSTYTGSTVDNWGETACFDNAGNAYAGGIIFDMSMAPFEPRTGAIQASFKGGVFDAVITRFNPDGTMLDYATYLGGAGEENPLSMITDPSTGDLIVLGTTSSANFPVTTSVLGPAFHGGDGNTVDRSIIGRGSRIYSRGSDLFLARLSPRGNVLRASSYLGGSGNEGNLELNTGFARFHAVYAEAYRSEVDVDTDGHILVASYTNSGDLPRTGNNYHGGGSDGWAFKVRNDLSAYIWSLYVGGSDRDALYAVQASPTGPFLSGATLSTDMTFPTPSFRARRSNLNADRVEGFVVHVASASPRIDRGTFLANSDNNSFQKAYMLDTDSNNDVYVFGVSYGDYPVQRPPQGTLFLEAGGRHFLHKFSNSLARSEWSTVFGPRNRFPSIFPTAFLVSDCGNIFLSGWGGSIQGSRLHETQGLPLTPDAYQSSTDGHDFYFMVLAKEARELLYGTYFGGTRTTDHVDGGTSRFDKRGIVYHAVCASCGRDYNDDLPTTPNAWSSTDNSTNCNLAVLKFDLSLLRSTFTIQANDNQDLSNICEVPFTLRLENASTGGVEFIWDFGDGSTLRTNEKSDLTHTYTAPGTYQVSLRVRDPSTCRVEDVSTRSFTIHAPPENFTVSAEAMTICASESTQLHVTGGDAYRWSPAASLDDPRSPDPTARPRVTTTYTVNIFSPLGCVSMGEVTVRVIPEITVQLDMPSFTANCQGNKTFSFKGAAENAAIYDWDLGDGNRMSGTTQTEITHTYATAGDYTVSFIGRREHCDDTTKVKIKVNDLKVPNVFTPNGDDVNDVFEIAGIPERGHPLRLKVYDRQGALVYESAAYGNDWTGQSLSSGVYFYELHTGSGDRCKGWVHLLR